MTVRCLSGEATFNWAIMIFRPEDGIPLNAFIVTGVLLLRAFQFAPILGCNRQA